MSAIIPIYPLTNRSMKRKFNKERLSIEHQLVDIECEFEYAVFYAPKSVSYNEIYEFFLNKWHEIEQKVLLTFEYSAINLHYFSQKYKSVI